VRPRECFSTSGECQRAKPCQHACDLRVQPAMPRECEHGSLRRSCERCADADEIAELRENRDRAVRLLHLAMAQLRRWNDAYGANAVTWLPPAGYVRLAEDVDQFTASLQGPNVHAQGPSPAHDDE